MTEMSRFSRLSSACLCLALAAPAQPLAAGAAAPGFLLFDQSGTERSLAGFRGRVVILNFWATWCKPCRQEMPALDRIAREYASRGVTVLGVAMDQRGWAAVTPFLAQFPVSYPILLGNPRIARDYGGLRTLPLTVFIRRDGRIAASHDQTLSETQLRKAVQAMLLEDR
jgi:thiol-disulfide isomerase/thioredoxin